MQFLSGVDTGNTALLRNTDSAQKQNILLKNFSQVVTDKPRQQ
jgi:hypothetical protein